MSSHARNGLPSVFSAFSSSVFVNNGTISTLITHLFFHCKVIGNLVDNDAAKCINDDHCLAEWSKNIIGKQITIDFYNHKYLTSGGKRIAIIENDRNAVKETQNAHFSKFPMKYSKETVCDEKGCHEIIN